MPYGARVPLTSLKTLTFKSTERTAARRTSPIPQLTCVGKACNKFQPDVVQCYNMGGSGDDVQWRCEAELPEGIKMGGVTVSCEGWDRPGDDYVLKGSCGLEYRLVQLPGTSYPSSYSTTSTWDTIQSYAFWAFFLGIAFFILYRLYQSVFPPGTTTTPRPPRPPNAPNNSSWSNWFSNGGGNWGAYGNNPDAPPPPYPGAGGGWFKPSSYDSWRPGFWTGLGVGGAAAHLYDRAQRPRYGERYDWERERYGYGQPRARPVYFEEDRGPASAGPSRPRQSGSGMGETRTSTGYGSTRVR